MNHDVTFSLTTSDPDSPSGISTYYGLDAPATTSYVGAVTVSAAGTTTISYCSVDASANVEATKTGTVRVDETPPSLSVDAAGPYTGSATVHASASDALSGLDHVEMKLDSGSWSVATQLTTSTSGFHTVYARAFDIAGNESDASATFTVVPVVYAPVWRFRNLRLGCHLLTASQSEFNSISRRTYAYEGVAFSINTATNHDPVYRFYNAKGGFFLYTADPSEAQNIRAKLSKTWTYQGPVFNVSHDSGGAPVVCVRNIKGGFYLWTADPNEVANIGAKLKGVWVVEGVAFYLAK